MLIWKLPEYRDAIDGDGGSDFILDQEALDQQIDDG